jgi:Flp pilus assembly protein TadG
MNGLRIAGRSRRPAGSAERGFVTAETALVLPSLMGLGLALVLMVVAAADQLRCADAAWEAARALARGEPPGIAAQAAHRLEPAGAAMSVNTADGSVLVRVSARLALSGALLPALHVDGRAQVSCEPATPCAGDGLGERAR